jgi:signal transduction histidine kinase/BarA-like signal transduction histidine kinase
MNKKKPFSRNLAAVLVVAILGLSAILAGSMRELLLSPDHIAASTGPKKGYYWAIAQYQLAYLQFQNQALLYASHRDADAERLRFRFDILESKFKILSSPSELTGFFREIPSYDMSMADFGKVMEKLKQDVRLSATDTHIQALLDHLNEGWPPSLAFANDVRSFEMRQRQRALEDFEAKREIIFIAGLLLILLFAAAMATLLMALRRQRNALEMMNKAAKDRQTFLAVVSHELRTPLQSITAAVDVLADDDLASPHRKILRRLENAARQLEAQMKDLTDYARLESGKLELRKTPFVLHEMLEPLLEDARHFAQHKGLAVSCSPVPRDAWYFSDPQRLSQILSNLLMNAVRYTAQGNISFQVGISSHSETEDRLTFTVEDTGTGIPENKLAAIFEPFTQIDQSRTRPHDGLGMGLAIVQGLVTSLGGAIAVESTLGQGTCFSVRIPVERYRPIRPETPISRWTGTPNVLVVDDNQAAREAFDILLNKLDVRHTVVEDADTAMRLLKSQRYDILLVDVEMPRKDGAALAHEVRNTSNLNRQVPIVAISAHAAEFISAEEKEWFDLCLLKPIRLESLRDTLNKLLNANDAR